MTENLPAQQQNRKPALTSGGGGVSPIIPRDIEQAFRLATAISEANMAPKAYNRDANQIMVGIMHGMEAGLTPMAALQSIAVINGNPTIWGDGMVALVRGSGHCGYIKQWIDGEGDDMVAVCETKRKGEDEPIRATFSVQDAKEAGLWGKAGPWKQYPKRMLANRARSFCLRDAYADVLRGLRSADEVEDVHLVQNASGEYVPEERPTRDQGGTLLPLIDFTGDETDLLTPSQWIETFKETWARGTVEDRALLIESNREIAQQWSAAGESDPMQTWNEYASALDIEKQESESADIEDAEYEDATDETEATEGTEEAEAPEDEATDEPEDEPEAEGEPTPEEQVESQGDAADGGEKNEDPPMPEPERKPVPDISVAKGMEKDDLTAFIKGLDKQFKDAPDAAWLKEWRKVNGTKLDALPPKAKARAWQSFEKQMAEKV